MGQFLVFILTAFSIWLLVKVAGKQFKGKYKNKNEAREDIVKIFNRYGLTISDISTYFCKYVGGHPDRDRESSMGILFGAKNGKLIFFEYKNIFFKGGLFLVEGGITPDTVIIRSNSEVIHLFEVPINNIVDIRYFDATTSRTIAFVVGNHWAVPIRMEKGDASVLIDWNNGRFNHSTEFRFVGAGAQGHQANKRANALRNTFIKMTQ